jgi:outer membrane lipoprotein-sorting protein
LQSAQGVSENEIHRRKPDSLARRRRAQREICMSRKLLLTSLAITLLVLAAVAQDLTVDQVIANNVQARGGLEKLKAIKSLRLTGKMNLGPDIEVPVVIELKRPNLMRTEFTLQGLTAIQAYDGKSGWTIMPFAGNKEPEPMGEEDTRLAAAQADVDGPLVGYKEKGNTVELLGMDSVGSAPAYKIKVTPKNGGVRTIYLDANSFLEIKMESKMTIAGTEREGESSMSDYKEVGGVMFAYSVEGGIKGSPVKQKMSFDKIEVNPTLDDARFKMPEVKKEQPKTPAAPEVEKKEKTEEP